MDFRKLRYFATVARAGSFVAASRQLNVSQPALGMRVKELEADLSVRLLDRTARGVVPTAAGEDLLRHCDAIFERVAAARDAMAIHRATPSHHFTLGVTPTPGKALLADLLALCGPQKGLTLTIREGLSVELVEQAKGKRVDMAFCYDPPRSADLTIAPLYREDLYLIGPKQLVSGLGTSMEFDRIADLPLVLDSGFQITRKLIEQVARERGVKLDVRLEIEPINLKRDVLIANDLCTIVPYGLFVDEIEAGALACCRIERPALARTLCLIGRPGLPTMEFNFMRELLKPLIAERIAEERLAWRPL